MNKNITESDHKLEIRNLFVKAGDKNIINGLSLVVTKGQLHIIMGPNGSGKSTLATALMGNPSCQILKGKNTGIFVKNRNLLGCKPEEIARSGIFLSFQSPIAVPGVSVINLLRSAYQEIQAKSNSTYKQKSRLQNSALLNHWDDKVISISDFLKKIEQYAAELKIPVQLLKRGIHDGFSGGEKKKIEMLEALVLAPDFAVFDEIDTGLDIDALKLVTAGITKLNKSGSGIIVITHNQRLFKYLKPDRVHILIDGQIAISGTNELIAKIEKYGFKQFYAVKTK